MNILKLYLILLITLLPNIYSEEEIMDPNLVNEKIKLATEQQDLKNWKEAIVYYEAAHHQLMGLTSEKYKKLDMNLLFTIAGLYLNEGNLIEYKKTVDNLIKNFHKEININNNIDSYVLNAVQLKLSIFLMDGDEKSFFEYQKKLESDSNEHPYSLENKIVLLSSDIMISSYYKALNQQNKLKIYAEKGLKLCDEIESLNHKDSMFTIVSRIKLYINMQEYEKALNLIEYCEKANIDIKSRFESSNFYEILILKIGLLIETGQFGQAKKLLNDLEKDSKEKNHYLSNFIFNKFVIAVEQGDDKMAADMIRKYRIMLKNTNMQNNLKERSLSRLMDAYEYELNKNYDQAIDTYDKMENGEDKILPGYMVDFYPYILWRRANIYKSMNTTHKMKEAISQFIRKYGSSKRPDWKRMEDDIKYLSN